MVLPFAFAKLLLLPLAVLAFVLLLLLFGALGLAVALAVISLLSRIWRFLSRQAPEAVPSRTSRTASGG